MALCSFAALCPKALALASRTVLVGGVARAAAVIAPLRARWSLPHFRIPEKETVVFTEVLVTNFGWGWGWLTRAAPPRTRQPARNGPRIDPAQARKNERGNGDGDVKPLECRGIVFALATLELRLHVIQF